MRESGKSAVQEQAVDMCAQRRRGPSARQSAPVGVCGTRGVLGSALTAAAARAGGGVRGGSLAARAGCARRAAATSAAKSRVGAHASGGS
jgi:hypothetical protein